MSAETETTDGTTGYGIDSRIGWPIGGAVGGAMGAAAFGILVWLVDPRIVEAAIPGIYGIEATGVVGWAIHLLHGAVLGLVFGFLITREPILRVLRVDVETEALQWSGWLRVVAAGFVFGLAVWAILPVIALPVWAEAVGTEAAADFPTLAVESLFGHLVFGLVLGVVFATTVNLRDRRSA